MGLLKSAGKNQVIIFKRYRKFIYKNINATFSKQAEKQNKY